MKFNPYCKNLKTRVFDIETTGLYAKQDHIVSASFIDTDGTGLVQFFSEAPANEDVIVEQILEELSKCDAVITYNGNMFDIPFVQTRAKALHVSDSLPSFWPIDLYRYLKAYWPMANKLENLKQKTVEFALGLDSNRIDEIGGGECIELYNRYVDWNEEEAKALILLHNGDDVRQLARISEKINFLPFHQIAFEKGFMCLKDSSIGPVIITESKLLKTKLQVKAVAKPAGLETDIYNDNYHLTYSSMTGEVCLDIFTQNKDGLIFVDLKNILGSEEAFSYSEHIKSGYLIIAASEIHYKECNLLVSKLLEKVF